MRFEILSMRRWACLAIALLAGCQYNPWASDFLKARPAEADLAGTYRVDAESLARRIDLISDSEPGKVLKIRPEATIVLFADRRVEFRSVPDVTFPAERACEISGVGTWKLSEVGGRWYLRVTMEDAIDTKGTEGCHVGYSATLHLFGQKPPYKLHVTIGDPDMGDAVQFEKVKP